MDNTLDAGIFLEDALQLRQVAAVHLFEGGTNAGDFFNAIYDIGLGIAEVVDDNYVVACILQFDGGVRTDEAGTAGDQNCLFHKA